MRNLRQTACAVEVSLERRGRFDVMRDAGRSRGQGGRKCEIRIRIGAGGAAFDAQRLAVADDAESGRPVVITPGDSGRRKRSGDISLVRRGIRRVKREGLADVLHPAAEQPAEGGGPADGAELLLAIEQRAAPVLVPQALVNVASRA